MRLFGRIRILVDHAGMRTDTLDGFPRGQFAGEKALHASADKEGFFVLYVQAGQYRRDHGESNYSCVHC